MDTRLILSLGLVALGSAAMIYNQKRAATKKMQRLDAELKTLETYIARRPTTTKHRFLIEL